MTATDAEARRLAKVRQDRIAAIRRMLRASIPFTMRQRLVAELAELEAHRP